MGIHCGNVVSCGALPASLDPWPPGRSLCRIIYWPNWCVARRIGCLCCWLKGGSAIQFHIKPVLYAQELAKCLDSLMYFWQFWFIYHFYCQSGLGQNCWGSVTRSKYERAIVLILWPTSSILNVKVSWTTSWNITYLEKLWLMCTLSKINNATSCICISLYFLIPLLGYLPHLRLTHSFPPSFQTGIANPFSWTSS